jgi:6-phospho-3-hexuloisomerase
MGQEHDPKACGALISFADSYKLVLNEIRQALDLVDPAQVEALVEAIRSADRVFVIGVGRVMLSLQALAKRLNHLGIETYCVGDTNEPAITPRDLLLVGSGSGESIIPVAIAKVAKKCGARVAHVGSNSHSSLAPFTDVFVRIPVQTKLRLSDELQSQQVMTSLFEQSLYLLGDAVALMVVRRCGLDLQDLWQHHANLE